MPDPRAAWLTAVLPPPNSAGRLEQWRASLAAFLALILTGALGTWTGGAAGLWLIAPMGASAVLLFCLPASPLAQPWAVIGGNVVSALVGVACVKSGLAPQIAAPLAGGLAIAAMFALRCLHPPGGAVALTAVLAGPAVHELGFAFALAPVALNCVLMVGGALLVNNLTGRRYPHRQQSALHNVHDTADVAPTARLGFRSADLDAVLARYGQVLDVSRDELEGIILATETAAYGRRFGVIRCGQIMSTDVVTLEFGTELAEAWRLMRHHQVHALPVLNRARRVIGIVTQTDFLRHSDLDVYKGLGQRLRALLQRSGLTHSDKPEVVGQIMTARVATAHVKTPIVELVPLMANAGLHHIPVVDDDDRFAGIVTQSDLVAALYQGRLAEPAELAPAA
ncbi:HPP family protein [Massilia atriviolacea]|uniref:HPP family protein n=1 Tax=Massilia atriviolacea TaxID=2495579 RepID=A0A430HID7_9BURK|nr:HPP family protein [Massilia atriviolacea]RSZ57261.1 HPP family protein [Massilia atriviolacea]